MFILLLTNLLFVQVYGHGMMLEPPNRSSLWRFDETAPANYDDNQNFCGGAFVQWQTFNGKCGVCGDKYDAPHPQDNENTGKYGQGVVVREYTQASTIDVSILLTTNHLGYFTIDLCVLNDPNAPESGEECFQQLKFGDGSTRFNVTSGMETIDTKVQLIGDLVCERCVLRWTYTAGNTWGACGDGTYAQGCGPQETFRSCADVAIL